MPTIQSGSTLERYFDNDTTITITPHQAARCALVVLLLLALLVPLIE